MYLFSYEFNLYYYITINLQLQPWLQLQKERLGLPESRESPLILPGQTPESKSAKNKSTSSKYLDSIEVAPLALASCEQVAHVLQHCRGAALFIDYGEDRTQEDSLRGFKSHKQVSVLSEPGHVDVTADVDFFCAARVLEAQGMAVLPLLTQRDFLLNMGLISRVEVLLEKDSTTEEQAELVVAQCKQLLGEANMGTRFKVLVCSYPALDMSTLIPSSS